MTRRLWVGLLLGGVLALAVACAPTRPEAAVVQAPPEDQIPATEPVEPQPATGQPTLAEPTALEPTAEVAAPTEPASQEPALVPGQRTSPAPPDVFVADLGSLVGVTGRPQLVEFFTYW